MNQMYSFIIPVYNRPHEMEELLQSFTAQDEQIEYEIIVVEDGSDISSEEVVKRFRELPVKYICKENSGPGNSRNFGMRQAKGDFFMILDSDCILPPTYFKELSGFIGKNQLDCFGGPDAAHSSFTPLQKAINYTMTSFLTTGGIRGNKMRIQQFEPRSFNMGLSKQAFYATGGFGDIHPGEDPDLVQRLLKLGYKVGFAPHLFVYHKRRITWKNFYKQVSKFGTVRAILNNWHPHSAKPTFWLPTLFVFFSILSVVLLPFFIWQPLAVLLFYVYLVFIDASIKNQSLFIGLLSVRALFVQFFGYGLSFLSANFKIYILKKTVRQAFSPLFFNKNQ